MQRRTGRLRHAGRDAQLAFMEKIQDTSTTRIASKIVFSRLLIDRLLRSMLAKSRETRRQHQDHEDDDFVQIIANGQNELNQVPEDLRTSLQDARTIASRALQASGGSIACLSSSRSVETVLVSAHTAGPLTIVGRSGGYSPITRRQAR